MSDERIQDWVQEKLENGVSKQRLRKVLENSGHDPEIVDEVESPFKSESDPTEEAENSFETEIPEHGTEDDAKQVERTVDLMEKDESESSFDLSRLKPSIELPSFSLPSISLPEVSFEKPEVEFKVPWRLLVVVLIIGVAFYGGTRALDSSNQVEEPDTVEETTEFQGCPDIGVRIISVSASPWEVKVDARVSRGPGSVVVELYRNNNLVAVQQDRFNGMERFKFTGKTADSVVLRPVGCYSVRDVVSIG